MEGVKKQICRLCLGVIPAGIGEVIEEINKEKLKVLLINVNFDISDNAIACNRCLENLQDCFDFKSTCTYMNNYIASCVNVDVKMDNKTVFEKQSRKESVDLENVQMCRLCMTLIKDESFNYSTDLKDDFFLKDMLRNCLLQVDLNAAHVPLICKRCLSSAKKYSDFMKTCHEVEERIKNYCQVGEGYGIAKVILEDVLEFKNCGTLSEPIVIKKECLDVANDDMAAMKCFKGEVTANIKCEEIDIKDELGIKVETSEPVQSKSCNNSGMNSSSKRKICAKTDTRSLLNAHMMSHKGSTKAFRCHECPFETNRKTHLKQHFLRHKGESEVEMHKCPLCPYKSKYKSAVFKHRKQNHGLNIKVYKCKDCSYTTKRKRTFERHQLIHKSSGQVPMYKCYNCHFETKFKRSLTSHMLMHTDEHPYKFRFNTLTKVFECRQCIYKTDDKPQLIQHFLKHKSKAEMYVCPLCTFIGKYKSALMRHWNRHHDKNTNYVVYKCKDCSYITRYEKYLMRHQVVHKNPQYKCEKCQFATKYKYSLTIHALVHEDSKFKCEECPYQCKRHAEMKRHMMIHSSEKLYSCELCTYCSPSHNNLRSHMRVHRTDCNKVTNRCDQCDFQTKYKTSLLLHKQRHHHTQPTFKCDKCEYCTIEKDRLKRHQLKHMELRDTMVYYCATCSYKNKHKWRLSRHIRSKKCLKTKKDTDEKEIKRELR